MNAAHLLHALVLALVAGFTTMEPARASDVSFQVHGKKASVGIHIGNSHHGHAPRPIGYTQKVWVPGHYETIQDRVWVEGRVERVWVAPVYEWRYDSCGRAIRVCVQPGRWKTIHTGGRYEICPRQVWVEGGWRPRPC